MYKFVLVVISCVILVTGCGSKTSFGPHPTQLQVSAVSSNQIKLTWNDNSLNEEGFEITRTGAGKTTTIYVDANAGGLSPNTIASYNDNGLNSNTTYSYKIRAYGITYDVLGGRSNYSPYSNEMSATTF